MTVDNITAHCISDRCPKAPDGQHDWTGGWVKFEKLYGGSASCKWCGMLAIDHDMMTGE